MLDRKVQSAAEEQHSRNTGGQHQLVRVIFSPDSEGDGEYLVKRNPPITRDAINMPKFIAAAWIATPISIITEPMNSVPRRPMPSERSGATGRIYRMRDASCKLS